MKSFQQILFNWILSEMKKQNWKRSVRTSELDYDSPHCAYSDPNTGMRCAVGVCLPKRGDSLYGNFQGDVDDLVVEFNTELPSFLYRYRYFMQEMQSWHDDYMTVANLRQIAKQFDLDIPQDLMPPSR